MTIHEAALQLRFSLFHVYDEREAGNIADLIMERVTGWQKIDRIVHKKVPLSVSQQKLLQDFTARLLQQQPVQYVLNEAWFYQLPLFVDEHVLIPRPETEELADWLLKDPLTKSTYTSALDIGTGSGCIALALKKNAPWLSVHACDISAGAINVASKNAHSLAIDIQFHLLNILEASAWSTLPMVDIIVSNPPYIPLSNQAFMATNVLAHEPALALFVADEDPLQFYHAIASFALAKLSAQGKLFFEIHEEMGAAVTALLHQHGFTEVLLKKDLQGKDRMVSARR